MAPFRGNICLMGEEGKKGKEGGTEREIKPETLNGTEREREKRSERGRNCMTSLGIPFGPGALPVPMPSEIIVLSNAYRVIMSASVRVKSPRGSMKNWSGFSGCSHDGIESSGGVARVSSVLKCEWTAARTAVEEVTIVLSGRVILWRVEVVRLWGRRRLLNFRRRWEDFGLAS
jgi:hypothetical protein